MINCRIILVLKNVVIIITSVIEDDGKFYPQLFIKKEFYDEQAKRKANNLCL